VKVWAVLLVIPAVNLLGAAVQAQEQPVDMDRFKLTREVYEYKAGKNRDPFRTLIRPPEKAKEEAGLTPLESFDLSQMRLVAVVRDKENYYALIGLPDGKHYNIVEGMPIGLHSGTVMDITLDTVLVREFIYDYRGRLQTEDSTLKLRKGEDN
jgi:type IV pilus assembly protein PilP